MQVTIYGCRVMMGETGGFALAFQPWSGPARQEVGSASWIEHRPEDRWVIEVPDGSVLDGKEPVFGCLVWDFQGSKHRSNANEVLALGWQELHGFSVKEKPAA